MPSRYISHSKTPPDLEGTELEDAKIAILKSLNTSLGHIQRLVHSRRNEARHGSSVYVGPSGATLVEHYLLDLSASGALGLPAEFTQSDFGSTGDKALLHALKYGDKGSNLEPSRCAFLETAAGVATLALLRMIQPQRAEAGPLLEYWESCIKLLQNATYRAGAQSEYYDDGCEVLYGRAGLLYALLRIRKEINNTQAASSTDEMRRRGFVDELMHLTEDSVLSDVVKAIIDIGKEGAKDYGTLLSKSGLEVTHPPPPLMWSWYGKMYLGGAHGVAGILQVLWNCPQNILAPHAGDLVATLEWLLSLQDSSGNWPSKAPDAYSDPEELSELIQWCHGATGIIIFLSVVARGNTDVIPLEHPLHERVIKALHGGASLVYRHGFLKKGVGLCHGVAGSVYALLAASKVSNNESGTKHLSRAVHLAQMATDYEELTVNGKMNRPDRPWSLYEGVAGMCCAWAAVVSQLNGGRCGGMPGFDDL